MPLQNRLNALIAPLGRSAKAEWALASEKVLYWLGRSAISLYTHSLLQMDVKLNAQLPAGPKIFVANHPTTMDPFFILAVIPEQTSVLVTRAAFQTPVFGRYLMEAGHVPAIRNSRGATVRALQQQIEAGRNVAIFPEGSLSPLENGLGFHKPHTGVARLALSTGAPVLPVGIGLRPERVRFFESELDGQVEAGRIYPTGPYAMTVGEPLRFEGSVKDGARVRSVAEHIMQHIVHLSLDSMQRIEPSSASVTWPESIPAVQPQAG